MSRPLSPYEQFIASAGWPVVTGVGVRSLLDLELEHTGSSDIAGAFVQLDGMQGLSGLSVFEMSPDSTTGMVRHLYEEWYLVLSGSGVVEFEASGGHGILRGQTATFRWKENSVFAIPLNMRHRLRNTGDREARIASITNAPLFMDLLGSSDAIFEAELSFPDREREIYSLPRQGRRGTVDLGDLGKHATFQGAVLEDAVTLELPDAAGIRGEGFGYVGLDMGGGIYGSHVGEVEERVMSNAHWHMGGAMLICVAGSGYSLAWPNEAGRRPYESGNGAEVRRQDYVRSGVVAVGVGWYHQHLNPGQQPMRQVAFRYNGIGGRTEALFVLSHPTTTIHRQDLDPAIAADYERALADSNEG